MILYLIGALFTMGLVIDKDARPNWKETLVELFALVVWPLTLGLFLNRCLGGSK